MKIFQASLVIFHVILPAILALTSQDLGSSEGFSSGNGDGLSGDDEPDGNLAPLTKQHHLPRNFNDWLLQISKGRKLGPVAAAAAKDSTRTLSRDAAAAPVPPVHDHSAHKDKGKENSFAFRFQQIELEMNHHPLKKNENKDKILYYVYKLLKHGDEYTAGNHGHNERSTIAKSAADENLIKKSIIQNGDAALAPSAHVNLQEDNEAKNCSHSHIEVSPAIAAENLAELMKLNATEKSNENQNEFMATTSPDPNFIEV